jgi:hypothetical protein
MNLSEYGAVYALCRQILHEESARIADSGTCRSYLQKNLKDGDAEELLRTAVRCITDLTGDTMILKALERRNDEDQILPG